MRAMVRASGVLAATGPLLCLLGEELHPGWLERGLSGAASTAWPVWVLWLSSLLVTLGGLVLPWARDLGRNLVVAGLGAWCIQAAVPALESPLLVLVALSGITLVIHLLYPTSRSATAHDQEAMISGTSARARAACVTALAGWPIVWLGGIEPDAGVFAAHGASLAMASLLVVRAATRRRAVPDRVRLVILLAGLAGVALVAFSSLRFLPTLAGASLIPLVGALSLRSADRRLGSLLVEAVVSHPARLIAVTFLGMSAAGAMLLRLPLASSGEEAIAGIDAVFTATSAVCVTGLIVLDTPTAFSGAGHVIILLLIQLGGLGIMTFSTAAIGALGRRLSLRHESAMADLLSGDRAELFLSLRRVLTVTFVAELIGAALLAVLFRDHGDDWSAAIWRGLFTAVSAFCNAGFALQTDSLIPYEKSPLILNVVAILIITGGLSPPVIVALPQLVRRKALAIKPRLVLVTTTALLVVGTILLGALEWSHAFGHLGFIDRVDAAWFQSVTLRTAGFNSVDFANLAPATLWVMLAFMFVGGSPGSTAGGIKTTTLAVLVLAVRGAVRGQWEATVGGRRLAKKTFYEAATIVTVAVMMVFTAVTALAVTQSIPLEPMLFEVVSALGTVGLSVGATTALDDVGKLIIMSCMFIGRIGPLTLFLFLRDRHAREAWDLPEIEVDVG